MGGGLEAPRLDPELQPEILNDAVFLRRCRRGARPQHTPNSRWMTFRAACEWSKYCRVACSDAEIQELSKVFTLLGMADLRIGDPRWDSCCGVLRQGGCEHCGASIVRNRD